MPPLRRTLLLALALAALAAPAPGWAAQPTGRLLASFKTAKLIPRVARSDGLVVGQSVPAARLAAIEPAPGQSLAELRTQLLADPRITHVEADQYLQLRGYVPNDPAYSAADSLNAPYPPTGDTYQWNLRKANFEQGWALSKGTGATVAIVDTGTSGTSPDLTQIAAAVDNDPTPTGATSDENGHGSHVSGLACGNSGNGYGVASSGFDCPIVIEKLDVPSGTNNLTLASLIAGITDAANRGVDVINLSLGGAGQSTDLNNAIRYAWAHDAVIVAAAENSNTTDQGFPARYVQPTGTAGVLATCAPGDTTTSPCARGLVVTMAQYDGANANAGHGTGVSIAAYGDSSALPAQGHPNGLPGIFSTYPAGQTSRESPCLPIQNCPPRTSFNGDNRFGYLFGTSMASPQVAGLAALIRSANPSLSASQVVQKIKQTASYGGVWKDALGWGIIDAGKALAVATGKDLTAPASKVKTKKRSRSRSFKVKIKTSDTDPYGNPSSGIDSVSVFAAKGKRDYVLVKKTDADSFRFKGKRRKRYRFYSRALDKAGNREPIPASPDSKTWIRPRR
jgi:serine protease